MGVTASEYACGTTHWYSFCLSPQATDSYPFLSLLIYLLSHWAKPEYQSGYSHPILPLYPLQAMKSSKRVCAILLNFETHYRNSSAIFHITKVIIKLLHHCDESSWKAGLPYWFHNTFSLIGTICFSLVSNLFDSLDPLTHWFWVMWRLHYENFWPR